MTIRYTWADQGEPQDGMLVLGDDTQNNILKAVWIDSWHMRDSFMVCEGATRAEGAAWVVGSYAVPPGPDWGWRIAIETKAVGVFRLVMHNISPEGVEELAVEATYMRKQLRSSVKGRHILDGC
jgi:hypothetical protein